MIHRLANSFRRAAKGILQRYPLVTVPILLLYNAWWAARLRLGFTRTETNAKTARMTPQQAADYIDGVFAELAHVLGPAAFRGTAAEIGPGGNAGVALLARRSGCEHVDLIDRFVIHSDPEQQAQVYAELSRRHDLDRFRRGDRWDRYALDGISWYEGQPAEVHFAERAGAGGARYDLVYSNTVLQHLYDPIGALRDLVHCLRPGGMLIHRIDLRDQGFFSRTQPELTWLRVSDRLWPYLTRWIGGPNRVLAHRYRTFMDTLQADGVLRYTLLVTRLVGSGDLDPPRLWEEIDSAIREASLQVVEGERHGLAAQFQGVAAEDLAITGIIVIARKADGEGRERSRSLSIP